MTSNNNNGIKAVLYVMSAAIVILFSMLAYGIHKNQDAIQQIHQIACAQKTELQHNISSTENFLKTHPQGIPGIPKKLILKGLAQNKAQLKTLAPVSCS